MTNLIIALCSTDLQSVVVYDVPFVCVCVCVCVRACVCACVCACTCVVITLKSHGVLPGWWTKWGTAVHAS